MEIFKKNEKPLDSVSTTSHVIDLKELDAQNKAKTQEWLDEQRKNAERQAEKNKPREEARIRVTLLRKEATIEKNEAFKRQGQFNFIRDSIAKLLVEQREHEKWFTEHDWKRIPESQEKPNGPYKKYAEWKKTFKCFEPTPYEIEDKKIRMEAQGYVQNEKGEWHLSEARTRLNEIIRQETR